MKLGDLLDEAGTHSDLDVVGISNDSRDVKPGYVFFAIPSLSHGKEFTQNTIQQALANGASVIIQDAATPAGSLPDTVVIPVQNSRQAFAIAAARFYRKQPEELVAVTGTNGKTSVAFFLSAYWQSRGYDACSIGTMGCFFNGKHVVSV